MILFLQTQNTVEHSLIVYSLITSLQHIHLSIKYAYSFALLSALYDRGFAEIISNVSSRCTGLIPHSIHISSTLLIPYTSIYIILLLPLSFYCLQLAAINFLEQYIIILLICPNYLNWLLLSITFRIHLTLKVVLIVLVFIMIF